MAELFTRFLEYTVTLPWMELVAMLLAFAYVILAAQGSLWCWPAAFISTALYTIVFYDVLLLMDSALNVYYLVMAIYGYWTWTKNTRKKNKENGEPLALEIISWQASWHLKVCLLLTVIAAGLGYVMANHTSAAFPYVDTFTTVFAVFATYLVTQKVLENWLYWLVIDAISIYLYIEKDLMPTAVLFIIYIFIAGYGYLKWRSIYKSNNITLQQAATS